MCEVKVNYNFPNCGHPSPMRKVCSQPITWACKTLVDARGQCGHTIRKECTQAVNTVECSFRPCVKLRSCGHPCTNVCGKDCNLGECGGCEEVRKKELQKMRHRYDKTLLLSIGGPLHSWLKLKKTHQKLDLKKREVDELGV